MTTSRINNMEKQFFLSKLRLHFNLREPNGHQPTPVYGVVCIHGRQHRYPTGVKVDPAYWDRKNQTALIQPQMSALCLRNNHVCNRRLDQLRELFDQLKKDIEQAPECLDHLPALLSKRLAVTEPLSASPMEVSSSPLEWLLHHLPPKPTYQSSFRQFEKWTRQRCPNLCEWSELDLSLLRKYEAHIRSRYSASRYNMLLLCLRLALEKALNDPAVGYDDAEGVAFLRRCHTPTRVKDDGRIALTPSQVDMLCSLPLEGKAADVRDMFVFQCLTSLRFSNVSGADFTNHRGEQQFDVIQVKEKGSINQTVSLLLDPRIGVLLDRHGWHFPKMTLSTFNRLLEHVIEQTPFADRSVGIKTRRADGTTKVSYKTMAQAIRSHNGRRTFITHLRSNPQIQDRDLMCFTGHSSVQMLQNYDKNSRQNSVENIIRATLKKQ